MLLWKFRLTPMIMRHPLPKENYNDFWISISGIVTFSDYKSIFGTSTIQISNGVDFNKIKLKQKTNDTSHELHLIGVAEIHYWHGFDRLVQGLVNYYKKAPDYKVFFHLVGNFFGEREKNDILPLIETNHLEPYIILHGAKHGEELDQLFEQSDMAIGSLARHPIEVDKIIEFYKKLNPIPLEIRSSILSLSWEAQMNKVIKAIEE